MSSKEDSDSWQLGDIQNKETITPCLRSTARGQVQTSLMYEKEQIANKLIPYFLCSYRQARVFSCVYMKGKVRRFAIEIICYDKM